MSPALVSAPWSSCFSNTVVLRLESAFESPGRLVIPHMDLGWAQGTQTLQLQSPSENRGSHALLGS